MSVEANVFNGMCIFFGKGLSRFSVFLERDCLGNMMGEKVVMEVVVEVVVLVWWR